MGPLNDEKELQVDETNNKSYKKNYTKKKKLKTSKIINFQTTRYEMIA